MIVRSSIPSSVPIETCFVPVVQDMLVDLVGDRDRVVFDAEVGDEREFLLREDLAGRVVRRS